MTMQHLTRASGELFRRAPDERFPSLDAALAGGQFGRGQIGTRIGTHGTTPKGVPTATSTGWRADCRTGKTKKPLLC